MDVGPVRGRVRVDELRDASDERPPVTHAESIHGRPRGNDTAQRVAPARLGSATGCTQSNIAANDARSAALSVR